MENHAERLKLVRLFKKGVDSRRRVKGNKNLKYAGNKISNLGHLCKGQGLDRFTGEDFKAHCEALMGAYPVWGKPGEAF